MYSVLVLDDVLQGSAFGYEFFGENVVVAEPGEEDFRMRCAAVIVVDIKGPVRSLGDVGIGHARPVSSFVQQQSTLPTLSVIL